MIGFTVRSCLIGVIAFLMIGCTSSNMKQQASEQILFTVIGNQPFADSVYTIDPDGSHVNQILAPSRGRSYMHASGNSFQGGLAVMVHELGAAQHVEDHIYIYRRSTGAFDRLLTQEGMEGAAYMSPDDKHVAFIFAPLPLDSPARLRLWITDLESKETHQLVPEDQERGVWYGYASWRPDGQEITFIKIRMVPPSVDTTLMSVPASGGEPTVLLGPSDNEVAAVCYAPDGKRLALMTKSGLELFEPVQRKRTLIRSWSSMENKQFRTGGIVWLRTQDKIAFTLFDNQSREYEIWTVSSSGNNAKRIYSIGQEEGKIEITSSIHP
jgi:Tol biopolymer transport system component